jgi:hypothetical protein
MTLAELLAVLPPTGIDDLAFPRHLLGAFRRKSITFCSGLTDEQSVVYWFQSRSFTIDLRLPDGAATAVIDRQGWTGDTLWDGQHLSWAIARSYQPRNQWPEPARVSFIGNSVIEFAPSGAYVEDWRQQATTGPLLGLRLTGMTNEATGERFAMDGGLVLAGDYAAYARSRLPGVDDALRREGDLARALARGIVTERQVESHEVSVAVDGAIIHSTQPQRLGAPIAGTVERTPDGAVVMACMIEDAPGRLHFTVDAYVPDFAFGTQTPATPEALAWLEQEQSHLTRHARRTA